MAASTSWRVYGETLGGPLSTRETVAIDTPERAAMSRTVARLSVALVTSCFTIRSVAAAFSPPTPRLTALRSRVCLPISDSFQTVTKCFITARLIRDQRPEDDNAQPQLQVPRGVAGGRG